MSIKFGRLIEVFLVWGIVGGVVLFLFNALGVVQGSIIAEIQEAPADALVLVRDNSVSANIKHYFSDQELAENPGSVRIIKVVITGYSSCPTETDGDPFITASGQWVQDGIVAANFLPFGTKIKIPELYGEEIFVIQDRMHPRKKYQVDIWFSSKEEAIEFGAHYTYIELPEQI